MTDNNPFANMTPEQQEYYEKIAVDTLKASLFNIIQFERKWRSEQRAKKKQGKNGQCRIKTHD